MNRRALVVAVLLCLCWTAPLLAQAPGGAATYRVTIVLYPGDDPAAVARRLAAMYRGALETPVDGNGSFIISLSEAGAGLMRRDPMVAKMDAPSLAPSLAPSAASVNAAVPAHRRWSRRTPRPTGPLDHTGTTAPATSGRSAPTCTRTTSWGGSSSRRTPRRPRRPFPRQTYTYDPYGNLRSISTAGRPATTFDMAGAYVGDVKTFIYKTGEVIVKKGDDILVRYIPK